MATLNEIAYDILSAVRPQLSDDTELDVRQIKFWIKNQRALLLRNEINRNRTIDSDVQQSLCVDLECVDASDCCDVEVGDSILKSVQAIPETIEMHNTKAITKVGPLNKKKESFSFIEYDRVPFVTSAKYTGNMVYAFLYNKHLYIHTTNPRYHSLSAVALRGVFENPEAASDFKDCGDQTTACYNDNTPYPINTWMIPHIKQIILKQFGAQSQAEVALADDTNNAKADAGQR